MGPELVVSFNADISKFQKGLGQIKSDLAAIEASTKKAATAQATFSKGSQGSAAAANAQVGAIQRLTTAIGKLDKSTSDAAKKMDSLGKETKETGSEVESVGRKTNVAANGLGGFLTGYLSVTAALAAGRAFIETAVAVESFRAQVNAAGRSQEDFAHNMQFIEGVADTYRKNTLELGKAFAMLANATKGTNLEGADTERLFKATVAASSALKLSMDDTTGTLRAFAQMVSKGNVQAEELRGQLGERLYGAFNLAAKAMGVTTGELNKMLERGEVLASDLLPKITVEMEKAFGDQAVANSGTLGNNLEYAAGQASLFFAEFGASSGVTDFFNAVAKDTGNLINLLRELNKRHGGGAAIGGLAGAAIEVATGGRYESPALKAARDYANYDPSKGVKLNQLGIGGEIKGESGPEFAGVKELKRIAKAKADAQKALDDAQKENEKKANAALNAQRDAWALEDLERELARIQKHSAEVEKEYQMQMERSARTVSPVRSADNQLATSNGDTANTSFTESPDKFLASMQGRIAEMALIPGVDWGEKLAMQELNDSLMQMDTMMLELGQTVRDGLANAAMDALYGAGQIAVAMAQGMASVQDIGKMVAQILSQLAAQIGQSLIMMAIPLLSNPITAPMGIANMAAGAALMVVSGVLGGLGKGKKEKRANGGFIEGRGGIDNVPTMLTKGELVLNSLQQRELFGILDGTKNYAGMGDSGPGVLQTRVQGSDLLIMLERAKRANASYG